jgi:nucleotide-binding universal stress UspA family protein
MIEQVLVAWDGSSPAAEAARWAAGLPGLQSLELIRVYDDVNIAADWDLTGGTEAGARTVLEREAEALSAAFPSLHLSARVIPGRRAEVLRALSRADVLLVLGTERRHGARLRFRFSLAARLAGSAAGPTAVVPEGSAAAHGPVLVGVDGSAGSRAAALLAADEAERRSVELVVLHAWAQVLDWDLFLPFDSRALPEYEAAHRRVLDTAVGAIRAARPGLPIRPVLVHDRPAAALLQAANAASLLVLGQHGRVPDPAGPPGSVTHMALLGLTVPTVVVGATVDPPGHPGAASVQDRRSPAEGRPASR